MSKPSNSEDTRASSTRRWATPEAVVPRSSPPPPGSRISLGHLHQELIGSDVAAPERADPGPCWRKAEEQRLGPNILVGVHEKYP